jgi:hypothetical protein
MRPENPLIVRTTGESAISIGNRMADMRTWLDRNGIELAGFGPVTLGVDKVAFDAQFRDLEHAALFRTAFGNSKPSVLPQPVAWVAFALAASPRRLTSVFGKYIIAS